MTPSPLYIPHDEPRRPGLPEVAVGLATYLVVLLGPLIWIVLAPDDQAGLRGIVGMAANGVAGIAALLAAFTIRIRNWRSFGFRPTAWRWGLIAAGLGVVAFGLSFAIEHVYFAFIDEPNTQADFQAAAKGGTASLAILVFAGAILTPLGEEVVFRGVIANALNRYGPVAGIVVSAAIFGVAHGLSVITILAFMVGLINGALLRRTGSLWPCLVVHVVYNGLHLLGYAVL